MGMSKVSLSDQILAYVDKIVRWTTLYDVIVIIDNLPKCIRET